MRAANAEDAAAQRIGRRGGIERVDPLSPSIAFPVLLTPRTSGDGASNQGLVPTWAILLGKSNLRPRPSAHRPNPAGRGRPRRAQDAVVAGREDAAAMVHPLGDRPQLVV